MQKSLDLESVKTKETEQNLNKVIETIEKLEFHLSLRDKEQQNQELN